MKKTYRKKSYYKIVNCKRGYCVEYNDGIVRFWRDHDNIWLRSKKPLTPMKKKDAVGILQSYNRGR